MDAVNELIELQWPDVSVQSTVLIQQPLGFNSAPQYGKYAQVNFGYGLVGALPMAHDGSSEQIHLRDPRCPHL